MHAWRRIVNECDGVSGFAPSKESLRGDDWRVKVYCFGRTGLDAALHSSRQNQGSAGFPGLPPHPLTG